MTRILTGSLLALVSLMASDALQAGLTATVDRTIITDLDSLQLTVRASDEASDADIDFSALRRDFDILNESQHQNQSLSFINGESRRLVYKDYIFTLQPRRTGHLTIPMFRAGGEQTRPITIRVQQQTPSQRDLMRQFVFFETSVDTNETWVQGQIIYAVKLFYSEAIGGDFPQPPVVPDTVIETIENEKRYETIVEGRRYYVLEKRYALFPQRSGELVIPGERFIGTRGRGGIFSQRQRVTAVSKAHSIRVKSLPEAFSGDTWIPARALELRESWTSEPPVFRVGEPVSRQITITATGLVGTLLPELDETRMEGAKVYADPPLTENLVTPDGVTARQVTVVGIVPTRAGSLTLPEIRIPWWNTQTDREEVAIIPAATLEVLAAPDNLATAPTVTVPLTELTRPTPASTQAHPWWQWAAIIFGLLWLLTAWQWLMLRRQMRAVSSAQALRFAEVTFSDPDEEREFADLRNACRRNHAAQAHRQLFLWARARYPGTDSTADLGGRHPALAEEIRLLEAHLFSENHGSENKGATWRGANLLKLVSELRNTRSAKQKNRALEAGLNPA